MNSEDAVRAQVEKEQDAEGVKERLEREYSELLEEIRVSFPEPRCFSGFCLRSASRNSSRS